MAGIMTPITNLKYSGVFYLGHCVSYEQNGKFLVTFFQSRKKAETFIRDNQA